jgi:hypothetical protein
MGRGNRVALASRDAVHPTRSNTVAFGRLIGYLCEALCQDRFHGRKTPDDRHP